MSRRGALVPVVIATLGCNSPQREPPPVVEATAPATRDGAEPSPVVEAPAAATRDVAEPTPSPAPPSFSLALLRDGPLTLRSSGDRAFLLVDGQPTRLDPADLTAVSGPTEPLGISRAGWWSFNPIAYAETPDGREAWLVATERNPRAGGLRDAGVYHRTGGRWARVKLAGEAGLLLYYSQLLVRGDIVLGKYAAAIDSDVADDLAGEPAERMLARAPQGFVRLAGPADAALPAVPDGWRLGDVGLSTDGTIYGLAWHEGRATTAVLAWQSERSEPDTIALPEVEGVRHFQFAVNERCVLVSGTPRYLALGQGETWRRLALELPDAPSAGEALGQALCTDAGEVWLILTRTGAHGEPERRLLNRSPGGAWSEIVLPPPAEEFAPEQRWLFDPGMVGGWVEARLNWGYAFPPYVESLAWADRRLWVLVDFGRLVNAHDDNWLADNRRAVYVSGSLAGPPRRIAGPEEEALARASADRRAPGSCSTFVIAPAGAPRAGALREEQRAALGALATTGDDGGLDLIYLGELDGRRELVIQATAYDRKSAARLVRQVGEALGVAVKADCRPRRLLEVVAYLRED